jgi:hypothetical protein
MGLLLIGVLAGILIGFGVFAPSHGYFMPSYASEPRYEHVASGRPLAPEPAASKPATDHVKAASRTPTKSAKGSSPKKRARIDVAKVTPPPPQVSAAAPDRPPDIPDPVLNKAEATVAAKMENPGSAEFSDVKRAMRKNTLGRSIDTICGHVKGRNTSGVDTGERPFLYLVQDDDAYVVDGKPNSAAAIAYRNICR